MTGKISQTNFYSLVTEFAFQRDTVHSMVMLLFWSFRCHLCQFYETSRIAEFSDRMEICLCEQLGIVLTADNLENKEGDVTGVHHTDNTVAEGKILIRAAPGSWDTG